MSKKSEAVQLEFPNGRSILTADGSEIPDPRPLDIPIGFEKPESIQEMIMRFVRDRDVRAELDAAGAETFEEADDFNVPEEDFNLQTPYEENFDPMHLATRETEIRAGQVRQPSPEEIVAARELLKKEAEARIKAKAEVSSKDVREKKDA